MPLRLTPRLPERRVAAGWSSAAGRWRVAAPRGGRPRLVSSKAVGACRAVSAARRAAARPPGPCVPRCLRPDRLARPVQPGPASPAGPPGAPASVSGPPAPGRPAPASAPGAAPGAAASTAAASTVAVPSPAVPSPAAPSPAAPSPAAPAVRCPRGRTRWHQARWHRARCTGPVAPGPVAPGPVAPASGPDAPMPGPPAVGPVSRAHAAVLRLARSPEPGAGLAVPCTPRGPKAWPPGAPPPGGPPSRAVRGRPGAMSSACEPQSRLVRRAGPGGDSSSITAQVWVAVRSAAASLSARAEYPGSASASAPPPVPPVTPSHAARVEAWFHEENWPGG